MRARVHKAQGNTELLAVVRKQIKSAKLRLRNALVVVASSSIGGRMGSGHATWAGLIVLESRSSRLKSDCWQNQTLLTANSLQIAARNEHANEHVY